MKTLPFLRLLLALGLCLPLLSQAQNASEDPRSTIVKTDPLPRTPVPTAAKAVEAEAKTEKLTIGSDSTKPADSSKGRGNSDSNSKEEASSLPFQTFVGQATGMPVSLFGRSLFANQTPSTFSPVEDAPVTGDYILGTGDEVLIRAWGQVDIDYRARVDRLGNINIPKVGVLHVAGTPYRLLTSYVRSAVSRVFRNFELNVTLGEMRAVQVFVVGHAERPGSYTVSAMSTLLNALFASGGPAPTGSMRRIQLKRGGSVISEFDLYDFIVRGDKSKDVGLQSGDVIQILPVGALAAVIGTVNTQAVFELHAKDTLGDLLAAAGGVSTTTDGRRATLERITGHEVRRVEELPLNSAGLARPVTDGDIVRLYAVSPRLSNVVTLRGNVAQPSNLPWQDGMRIRTLIPDRTVLLNTDYWQIRNAAVRADLGKPGYFKPRVMGEINWDYAVIERIHPLTLSVTLIPFSLARALNQPEGADNHLLQPGDVVTIFSKEDIRSSRDSSVQLVTLEGEVKSPGIFRLEPGDSLHKLLARVGGVLPSAYLFGTELTRESMREAQQQRMGEMIQRLSVQTELEGMVSARNSEIPPTPTTYQVQRSFLDSLATIKATGRILLGVKPTIQVFGELPDLPLENGDRIFIPSQSNTVSVVGALISEPNLAWMKDRPLEDYLALAGGPSKGADMAYLYIQRADGSTWSRHQSGLFGRDLKIMPGDTIVVPYETDASTWRKILRDWSQIFYQFGISVAAFNALKR